MKHAEGVLVELVLYRPVGYNAFNTHVIGPNESLHIALSANFKSLRQTFEIWRCIGTPHMSVQTDGLLWGRYNAKAELPFLITDKRSQWGKTTWGLTRCSGIQLWSKTVRFRIFRVKTFCFWQNIGFLRHKVKNGMLPHEEQSSSRSETHIYKHQMTKQQSFHYQNVQKNLSLLAEKPEFARYFFQKDS